MNKITSSIKITDKRGCPVRDILSVEKQTTTRCPIRDNISVEHITYLTARLCSREYSISTDIPSLTGCCPAKNANEDFILSTFLYLYLNSIFKFKSNERKIHIIYPYARLFGFS